MHMLVADFLQAGKQVWDEAKLREILIEQDVEDILAIPLAARAVEDNVIWHYSERWLFSVKTAYYLEVEHNRTSDRISFKDSSSSCSSPTQNPWSILWSANIPNKVKIFSWRVSHNALPTKDNLIRRGMELDPSCNICGEKEESLHHLIFSCSKSLEAWAEVGFRETISSMSGESCKWWLFDVAEKIDKNEFELFLMTLWGLWHSRNQIRLGFKGVSAKNICLQMAQLLNEFQSAHMSPSSLGAKQQETVAKRGTGYTIWVDGAWLKESKKGGIGVVIFNEEGKYEGSKVVPIMRIESASTTEALAIQEGLIFAHHLGYANVSINSDALSVIREYRKLEFSLASYGGVVEGTKCLERFFSSVSYNFVRRIDNSIAHRLAHVALNLVDPNSWVGAIPQGIASCFAH